MKYLFLEYPKCSTCQKARQWLLDNGVEFEARHIVDNRPSETELKEWIEQSGREPRSFFNASGLRYKALNLKEKLPGMSDAEQISLLASDGMLVKRPLLVGDDLVLVGFKEAEWERALKAQ